MPGGFAFTPFNDDAALERTIDGTVAAFIVEPVQGESGVHVADRAFLAQARRLCDERGALLVFDEIQCGMGRLGTTFAFESVDVRPDLVTMAKALANGLPIGAVLVSERCADALRPGDHGSTFGGSPVPCAAALTLTLLLGTAFLVSGRRRRSRRRSGRGASPARPRRPASRSPGRSPLDVTHQNENLRLRLS